MASTSTLSDVERAATSVPPEPHFYSRFGVAKSGILNNLPNIQRGLRFSDALFDELKRVLEQELRNVNMLGANLRSNGSAVQTAIDATIRSLSLPNYNSDGWQQRGLHCLAQKINEPVVKQEMRRSLKRDSTESHESPRLKSTKLPGGGSSSSSMLASLTPSSAAPLLHIKDLYKCILIIKTTDSDRSTGIRLDKIMLDPSITEQDSFIEQLSYSKLIQSLRFKKLWTQPDEEDGDQIVYRIPAEGSSSEETAMVIMDSDDLQCAVQLMFSSTPAYHPSKFELVLERKIRETVEGNLPSSDERLQSSKEVRAKQPLLRPPGSKLQSTTSTAMLPPGRPSIPPVLANRPKSCSAPLIEDRPSHVGDPSSIINIPSDDESDDAHLSSEAVIPPRFQKAHPTLFNINIGEVVQARMDNDDLTELGEDDREKALAMMKEEERPQWSAEIWAYMERLFNLRPGNLSTDSTRPIRGLLQLQGVNGPKDIIPHSHQLYDVAWRRQRSERYGGAINGDEMGFGKTLMIFLSFIFERQLSILHQEINRSKRFKTLDEFNASDLHKLHLPPHHLVPQTERSSCPRADRYSIGCPCEVHGVTQALTPKRGIFMVIVPAKLVGNWLAEWTKMIDTSDRNLKLRCFYAHSKKSYTNVTAERLTPENGNILRCNPDGSARDGQERIFLLCSQASYENWVKKILYNESIGRDHCFAPGQIYRDEFHEVKSKESITARAIHKLKAEMSASAEQKFPDDGGSIMKQVDYDRVAKWKIDMPWVFGFSATPWTRDLCDCATMISLIEQPWWAYQTEPWMGELLYDNVMEIGKQTASLRNKKVRDPGEEAANFRETAKILDLIEIKRTCFTKDIQGLTSLVNLPPHERRHIWCEFSEEQHAILKQEEELILEEARADHFKAVEAARKRGLPSPAAKWGNYFKRAHKLSAATVIPALLEFSRKYDLALTEEEMKGSNDRPDFPELSNNQRDWTKYPEESIYAAHLLELTDDAPKLKALQKLIDQLKVDIYGKPEKLVIFTSVPVVALIVNLWLNHHYPQQSIWCSSAVDISRREEDIVAPFQQNDTSRFLVSTKRILGTGVTLTRAFRTVSLDLDWVQYFDIQSGGRVTRLSQMNLKTYNYYILMKGEGLDMKILSKQARDDETRKWVYQTG